LIYQFPLTFFLESSCRVKKEISQFNVYINIWFLSEFTTGSRLRQMLDLTRSLNHLLCALLKYSIGLPLFTGAHKCPDCGRNQDNFGHHALSCNVASGSIDKHNSIVNGIFKQLKQASIQKLSTQWKLNSILPTSAFCLQRHQGTMLVRRCLGLE
jgi:hypothetical protein